MTFVQFIVFLVVVCVQSEGSKLLKTQEVPEEKRSLALERVKKTFIVEYDGPEDMVKRVMAESGYVYIAQVRFLYAYIW